MVHQLEASADRSAPRTYNGWVLLLATALVVVAYLLDLAAQPFPNFHLELSLAGDRIRWDLAKSGASTPQAQHALTYDSAFALAWIAVVPTLCRYGLARGPDYRKLSGWRFLPNLAVVAGVLDLIENTLIWNMFSHRPPHWLLVVLSTVGWLKLTAYAVAVFGLLWCVAFPVCGPPVRRMLRGAAKGVRAKQTAQGADVPPEAKGPSAVSPLAGQQKAKGLGICLSGGGIRAASIALGALRGFEEQRPGQGATAFQRANWLAGVSGGGYTACGWWVSRFWTENSGKATPDVPAEADPQDPPFFAENSLWSQSVAKRLRYLDNPIGGMAWGATQVFARTLLILGAILSAACLIGFGLGFFVIWFGVDGPITPHGTDTASTNFFKVGLFPARLLWAPLVLLTMAISLSAGVGLHAWNTARRPPADSVERARWTDLAEVARLLAVGAAALVFMLFIVPAMLKYAPGFLARLGNPTKGTGGSANDVATGQKKGSGIVGLLTSLGLFSAIVGVIKRRLSVVWLRLGGILLAVAWALVAEQAAQAVVFHGGSHAHFLGMPLLLVSLAAILWLILADSIPSHQATLNGVYRKRLAGTFALDITGPAPPLAPIGVAAEPAWGSSRYPADDDSKAGPELIVCATVHSSTPSSGGVKGYGFTFSNRSIDMYVDGARLWCPPQGYPNGSWISGFPRAWTVTRSMAISGAAFASAMGRQALGTTNALLAATSLRLGAWVPNPKFCSDFEDTAASPRVHLGYLVRELFGRYRPDRDPFVYVADGGHRDNLGLSEILRKKPRVALCVDASGDQPGSFTTLHECIALARLEQGVTINLDWTPVAHPDKGLPADCVAIGTIDYGDGDPDPSYLVYGRYQPCKLCSGPLQAYAKASPPFPYYSTGDQILTDVEFRMLTELGEHLGSRMCAVAWTLSAYQAIPQRGSVGKP